MAELKKQVIGYVLAPPRELGVLFDPRIDDSIARQTEAIEAYVKKHSLTLLATIVEAGEKKRNRNDWPQLEVAIGQCIERDAMLVVAELGNYLNNDAYTGLLIQSKILFHCCDQPLVKPMSIAMLADYHKRQRERHGLLIKSGLERSDKKFGNPNAKQVIKYVNRPKVEKAIIFAMLLQPVVHEFREKGFSQRRMVQELNDLGITAPEGGQWVLSQLQKVLDRIRLNELSLILESELAQWLSDDKSFDDIAEILNERKIDAFKDGAWDERQVKKLIERASEIDEVMQTGAFFMELAPKLEAMAQEGLTETQVISRMVQENLAMPACIIEEAMQ